MYSALKCDVALSQMNQSNDYFHAEKGGCTSDESDQPHATNNKEPESESRNKYISLNMIRYLILVEVT